jgi:hypothetical protein
MTRIRPGHLGKIVSRGDAESQIHVSAFFCYFRISV